jgi:predicted metal-dependent hydrolase
MPFLQPLRRNSNAFPRPKARRIWLNLELIKKPHACLEYVLLHELVHLRARNHDARFLALMDCHLPTWSQRRAELPL